MATAATAEAPRVVDGLPPGPRLPGAAQMLAWVLAPTWLMDRCFARYGSSFTITLNGGRRLVLFADPAAIRTIFTAPPELAPSAASSTPIAAVLGPSSVLTLIGPAHLRQRKLLLPPFHGERLREYEAVFEQATRRALADWPAGVPVRAHPRMQAITLEVILRAVFGLEAERMETLRAAITNLLTNATVEALREAFLGSLRRGEGSLARKLRALDELIYAELGRRRAADDLAQRTDILSLLLLARDEEGQGLTDAELRDELVTLLLAGHETTATALSWAFERLVRHPAVRERLLAEIDRGEDAYLEAVIHETLRVRPVVPNVVRLLTAPMRIGDDVLPAGARVAPSIYLANRHPGVYEQPEEFRPERFLGRAPDTYAWIPFGGGIRRCIGASFALFEMRTIMATILRELEPVAAAGGPGSRVGPRGGARLGEAIRRRAVTLTPASGARIVWQRR
jgi:cytochrome P450